MKKNVSISLKRLKEMAGPETTLMNFRIEVPLKKAFAEFCEEELDDQDMSTVLRNVIEELCVQNGYYKK